MVFRSSMAYNAPMPRPASKSRYSRVAPATAAVATALHSASSRMGHHLELALASELIASEVALPWTGGVAQGQGNRFATGPSVYQALTMSGVKLSAQQALADFWFISSNPQVRPSLLIQLKSGGQLGKAQRSGEATALLSLADELAAKGLLVCPVLCAFDSTTDDQAVVALGKFDGIYTLSGPSLCFHMGIDYDRVNERWESCAGDTFENDQLLANGLFSSLVAHYGEARARQMWQQASSPVPPTP